MGWELESMHLQSINSMQWVSTTQRTVCKLVCVCVWGGGVGGGGRGGARACVVRIYVHVLVHVGEYCFASVITDRLADEYSMSACLHLLGDYHNVKKQQRATQK